VKSKKIKGLGVKVYYRCHRCKIISVVTTTLNAVVCGMCRELVVLNNNLSNEEDYRRLWG